MKRLKSWLVIAAAVTVLVFAGWIIANQAPVFKNAEAQSVPPSATLVQGKLPVTETSVSQNAEDSTSKDQLPAIELLSVGTAAGAGNFMANVMALGSAEVRALLDQLQALPGNTPQAQSIMMKLTYRLDHQDFPYLLQLIDDAATANEGKDNLIQVAGRLNNPAMAGALQNLVANPDIKDDEPLFHAAVASLVRFGTEESLARVFHRLETAASEESTNALVTLLVEHRNPAAEAYLHALIQNPATNFYVSNTAVYMLANHPTPASTFLLQQLMQSQSAFKPAAVEAMAKLNN